MWREFFVWLFKDEKPLNMEVFSFWHILYTVIILAATIAVGILFLKKSEETKSRLLSAIAIAVAVLYIGDFFVQPFMHGDPTVAGEMNIDKLPFHICTIMCPALLFVQFNKRFARFAEAVAILSIVGPLMYITYPNGALGGVSPFSYRILQTFLYHGLVFCWGFNMLALGKVKPSVKRCWQPLIGLCLIAVISIGANYAYGNPEHHYDWFFTTGSSFSYAFPEAMHPYLPYVMPFIVIAAIFAVALAVYGIYYLTVFVKGRIEKKMVEKKAAEKEPLNV